MIFQFQQILMEKKIYRWNQVPDLLEHVRKHFRFSYCNSKVKYFNVPAAFDIETSSFYLDGEKTATMYVWQFGLYGAVVIGRTWEQFISFIRALADALKLNEHKRLIVYVHSLSYEFQWFRKYFTYLKVFSLEVRKPIYALTDFGIEFRCSYLLSGYNLKKLGDQLQQYDVKKMVGDLDYQTIRHSKTKLTKKEIGYCVNDVKVVMAYIMELIEKCGGISRIPLTKTGFVRQYCRNNCFYDPDIPRKESFKRARYKEMINRLVLDSEEYNQLKRAFQGGFTHCNWLYSGRVMTNVSSFDFTSSYPAVICAEQFPMSPAEKVEIKSRSELEYNTKLYCCLFDAEFINLEPKRYQDSYLSRSRCRICEGATINNGRVFRADRVITTLTEQDYMILKSFYRWDKMRVANFKRYKKDYLPRDLIISVLDLYQQKTTLKDVKGMEAEYLNSKEMINSVYGMMVTDIIRDEVNYFDDWCAPITEDPEIAISKYNRSPGRFLFYPWGVWVTAYARANLFTAIKEFGSDYIYSDTDSIKAINADRHKHYIEKYNKHIIMKLETALVAQKIDPALIRPKTRKGIEKPLGVWDFEGTYKRFKSLGAKRYMVETDEGLSITVAGLNKNTAVPWMKEIYSDPFNAFSEALSVPPEHTGKLEHTYIDNPTEGIVVDFRGVAAPFKELSSIHLQTTPYTLSLSQEYTNFLLNRKEVAM